VAVAPPRKRGAASALARPKIAVAVAKKMQTNAKKCNKMLNDAKK